MFEVGDRVVINGSYPGFDDMADWEREIRTISEIVDRDLYPIVLENGDVYYHEELYKVI